MRDVQKCVIVYAALFLVGGLYAARPFSIDDAGTVEKGVHEIELGCDFWSDDFTVGAGFKHGLTDRMDIGVDFGRRVLPETDAGFGDAELSLKFALIPDLFSTSITGSFGHGSYYLNGIITRTFGLLEIDANLGYETGEAADEDGTVVYALALLFNHGPYTAGIEGSGDKDGLQSWLVGGHYAIFDGFALDAGFSGGFREGAELMATAGIHYEF